jgi:hypothetical protein
MLVACMLAGFVVGSCGGSKPAARVAAAPTATASCFDGGSVAPEPEGTSAPAPFTGPMAVVEATHMAERLSEVGLDPKNLPPFEKLDRRQKARVMKTFTASLGIQCIGCHDLSDFAEPSPRKRVAKRMWNEMVRVLAMADGSPVYCDSCHQGSLLVLDRAEKKLVAGYMDDVMVGKLKRIDGKDHDCGTCHGDPPEFHFIAEWRKP